MTIAVIAANARRRYREMKAARKVDPHLPEPRWNDIVFEMVTHSGYRSDEVEEVMSKVNIEAAAQRRRFVQSWKGRSP